MLDLRWNELGEEVNDVLHASAASQCCIEPQRLRCEATLQGHTDGVLGLEISRSR